MTQTTPERKPCGTCGNEYTVTANGTVRHHFTDNPDFQAGPDSRKCKGAGQPPAGAAPAGTTEDGGHQCRLCKHPVVLTGNGRSRSHLTPEQTPRPCPGGSDFPLGTYPDIAGTTDGLVATLARDCGHVPAGECYACAGVPVPTMADRLAAVETDDFGQPVRECFNCDRVGCTGCGDAPVDDGRPEASRFLELLEQETRGAGTVLDRLPATDHRYTDPSGVEWVHPGPEETCDSPDCALMRQAGADDHRCPGCGTHVPHGVTACVECTARVDAEDAERKVKCTHPDGFRAPLSVDGKNVPACEHCNAVEPADCAHPDGYGAWDVLDADGNETTVEACLRCGALAPGEADPSDCTHPQGFVYTGADENDEDRHACPDCGAPDPTDRSSEETHVVADDSDDPEHVDDCPGCPDPTDRQLDEVTCVTQELDRRQAEEDAWRTPADLLAKMPEDVRDLDALRLDCAACRHPVTPLVDRFDLYGNAAAVAWACRAEFLSGHRVCRDHECTPNRNARLGDLDEGDHFVRRGALMRLTERESSTSVLAVVVGGPYDGREGELKNQDEVVERAPGPRVEEPETPDPAGADQRAKETTGPVLLGHLETGDHFVRNGTLMRVTGETNGVVHAVVVGGPYDGRTGDLTDLGETVERTHCRHSYSYADDGLFGHSGTFCDFCGTEAPDATTKEQEPTECTDDRTPQQQRPASSEASATTGPTTAPAPGSRPPTAESARDVSPESRSVTSSAPTARAAGNGRSAAVTTDQNAAAAAFLGTGRPSAPVQPAAADQNAAAAAFLAGAGGTHGEKETKRDGWGRYLIPHPDTGKEQAWTRATTFAKSISDTFTLSQWQGRMTLLGATMRPDIVQRAHGKHVKADRALLNGLVEDAKKAAGDKVAANLGTAMHSFTELADRAWHTPEGPRSVLGQVPPDAREDVETYIRLLEEMGLEPVPHLIEFTTVIKQYAVAGTSDNCYRVTRPLTLKIGRAEVRLSPGEHVIGDKKTGKDLDYGWQEIAIQLALYAQGINTAGVWDRHEEVWHPDPLSRFSEPGTKVRTDVGIVVHLPVDKESDKTPTVYGVDLESGWNAAVLCERVRAWRKTRKLASPAVVSGPAEAFASSRTAPEVTSRTTVRPASLRDRANAVASKGDASAVWTQAVKDGLPQSEVDDLVRIMQARLTKLTEPGG